MNTADSPITLTTCSSALDFAARRTGYIVTINVYQPDGTFVGTEQLTQRNLDDLMTMETGNKKYLIGKAKTLARTKKVAMSRQNLQPQRHETYPDTIQLSGVATSYHPTLTPPTMGYTGITPMTGTGIGAPNPGGFSNTQG